MREDQNRKTFLQRAALQIGLRKFCGQKNTKYCTMDKSY